MSTGAADDKRVRRDQASVATRSPAAPAAPADEKEAAHILASVPQHGKGVAPTDGTCRGCGNALSAALVDASDKTGLHANCVEPAPPVSTLADMEAALYRLDASRARSQQIHLGPSELGTPCGRQIAYKLTGAPEKDRGLAWAPLCGTAVHTMMEECLTLENERLGRQKYLIEEPLQIDHEITGHGDAFDVDTGTVIDWKYTGTTARRKAKRRNVPNQELVSQTYRVQTHLYGLGHANAGRAVKWVRVVMLARSHAFEESVEWTERYREDIAQWALDRYHRIKEAVAAGTKPQDVAAKPSDENCKWCPFWNPGSSTTNDQICAGKQLSPETYLRAA